MQPHRLSGSIAYYARNATVFSQKKRLMLLREDRVGGSLQSDRWMEAVLEFFEFG